VVAGVLSAGADSAVLDWAGADSVVLDLAAGCDVVVPPQAARPITIRAASNKAAIFLNFISFSSFICLYHTAVSLASS